MFEKLKAMLRIGGSKVGLVDTLDKIIDHPKISMPESEYNRILDNKNIYMQQYKKVKYLDSNGESQEREYKSINVAKVISRRLAKLVFNEGCAIAADNKDADKYLQNVFKSSKFRKNFGEELEAGYALGGVALRPYYDAGTRTIKIAFCPADCFFPLSSNSNDVNEAAIATVTQEVEDKKTIYYTLLEFHEWIDGVYTISNELYRSEKDGKVGVKVPLGSLDKYKDLVEVAPMVNFTRPLFVYIKLAGKNNACLNSPLGAGVIDNAKRQLEDINEKYDQFMWEIEKSATKILASDHFFRVRYDEDGQPIKRFESKTDVFQKLKADDPFIDSFAPSLRANEFIESINFILRIVEMQTGFSAGTFSFDGQSVKTATEVISEDSETFSTRSDNVQIVEEAIKELVTTIFEFSKANKLFKGEVGDVSVDFDDGVFTSKEAQLDYNLKAVGGQVMPIVEAIKRQFNLTDNEAKKWYNNILTEQSAMAYDVQEQNAHDEIYGGGE
ncbi:A118 family predicted phage portal protein [Lachnospiraceae bacterium PFB1-21]